MPGFITTVPDCPPPSSLAALQPCFSSPGPGPPHWPAISRPSSIFLSQSFPPSLAHFLFLQPGAVALSPRHFSFTFQYSLRYSFGGVSITWDPVYLLPVSSTVQSFLWHALSSLLSYNPLLSFLPNHPVRSKIPRPRSVNRADAFCTIRTSRLVIP